MTEQVKNQIQMDHVEKGTTYEEEDVTMDDALKVVAEERIELTEEDVRARTHPFNLDSTQ